jgi:hypothetical protein
MKSRYALLVFGFLLVSLIARGQTEVGLSKLIKQATVVEFKPPYQQLFVFLEEDEEERYGLLNVDSSTVFLKKGIDPKSTKRVKDPKNLLTAADIRPGMKVNVNFEHFQISLVNRARFVTLAVEYYGPTRVRGLYEKLSGEVATVDGQLVRMKPEAIVRGLDEWSDKKFTSLNDMQLGSEMDLNGKRETDGIITVERGTVRPVEVGRDDRLLRRSIDRILKLDKNTLIIGDRKYELVSDPSAEDYINRVGSKLVPQYITSLPITHPDRIGFKFYVVKNDAFNAFALPNGAVVVHTGLLNRIENEAQLAAVLGHEIAHITQKHHASKFRQAQNWNDMVGLAAVTDLVLGAGGALLVVSSLTSDLAVGAYSRKQESQADRVGLNYVYTAGYDIRETALIWKRLAQQERENSGKTDVETENFVRALVGSSQVETATPTSPTEEEGKTPKEPIYASHPRSRERFTHVNYLLSTSYSDIPFEQATRNAEQYRKFLDRLNGKTPTPLARDKVNEVGPKPPPVKKSTSPKGKKPTATKAPAKKS